MTIRRQNIKQAQNNFRHLSEAKFLMRHFCGFVISEGSFSFFPILFRFLSHSSQHPVFFFFFEKGDGSHTVSTLLPLSPPLFAKLLLFLLDKCSVQTAPKYSKYRYTQVNMAVWDIKAEKEIVYDFARLSVSRQTAVVSLMWKSQDKP